MIDELLQDLRFSLRLATKNPGFTATAVLPVALGIAAAATMFSVVHSVLLKPLQYPHSERLARIAERRGGGEEAPDWASAIIGNTTFEAWAARGRTIEGLAVYGTPYRTIQTADEPLRVQAAKVSANFFDVLGVSPARGRFFRADEDRPDGTPVVVLSHRLWLDRFGGREEMVGQSVTIDEQPSLVIGIAPPEFHFPDTAPWETELWTSHALNVTRPGSRSTGWRDSAIALLRPGVSVEQAKVEATAIARQAHADDEPSAPRVAPGEWTVDVLPMVEEMTRTVRLPLLVMLGAAVVVLCVATANTAALLMARTLRRTRELAVKAAIGASMTRLARELMTDAVVIAAMAAILGLGFTVVLHRFLPAWMPADFPRLREIAPDWRVLTGAIGASTALMLVAAVAPVRLAWRVNLVDGLKAGDGSRVASHTRPGRQPGESLRLVAEVAVSCTLLIAAGLLTRSFLALMSVNKGYDPDRVLTAQVGFPSSMPQGERRQVTIDLLGRLTALHDVQAAGLTNAIPLETVSVVFTLDDTSQVPPLRMAFRVVSPGYFEALGMHIVEGRAFDWHDVVGAPPVVIVNQAFLRKFGAGQRFPSDQDGRRWAIVGVVNDVRDGGLTHPAQPTIYRSYPQDGRVFFGRVDLVIRTAAAPLSFVPALRRVVHEMDRRLTLYQVATMAAKLDDAVARPRLYSAVLIGFAGLVLAIVGTGLFGALAYAVSQRKSEIAIRTALGATAADVLKAIAGRTALLALVGLLIGVGGALALSRLLASLVFGIVPRDPMSFSAGPVIVMLVICGACAVPLYRAVSTSPAEVLRSE